MASRDNEFKNLQSLDFPFVDGLCTVYKKDFIVLVSSGNKRAYIVDEKGRDLSTEPLYYRLQSNLWIQVVSHNHGQNLRATVRLPLKKEYKMVIGKNYQVQSETIMAVV